MGALRALPVFAVVLLLVAVFLAGAFLVAGAALVAAFFAGAFFVAAVLVLVVLVALGAAAAGALAAAAVFSLALAGAASFTGPEGPVGGLGSATSNTRDNELLGMTSWVRSDDEVSTQFVPSDQTHELTSVGMIVRGIVPFGRLKTPVSEPFWSARLNCAVNTPSETPLRSLFACTYFLSAWRL